MRLVLVDVHDRNGWEDVVNQCLTLLASIKQSMITIRAGMGKSQELFLEKGNLGTIWQTQTSSMSVCLRYILEKIYVCTQDMQALVVYAMVQLLNQCIQLVLSVYSRPQPSPQITILQSGLQLVGYYGMLVVNFVDARGQCMRWPYVQLSKHNQYTAIPVSQSKFSYHLLVDP